ncbi:PEP-CTERM putative exosortase interaction domain-containing protein [Opitutaceae bacterium TAV1]|nr:PEP-CTERM putative exosortase interaction domain-containing protein [Opitutaceae bacterium TAV1]
MHTQPKHHHAGLAGLACAAALASTLSFVQLHAATFIELQDFESSTAGVKPSAPWAWWVGSAPGPTTGSGSLGTVAVTDTRHSPFGTGAGTNSLSIEAINTGSPSANANFTSATTDALLIQFDLYLSGAARDPAISLNGNRDGGGSGVGFRLNFANGSTNNFVNQTGGGTAVTTNINSEDGSPMLSTRDTWYHVEITTRSATEATDQYKLTVTPYGGQSVTSTWQDFRYNLIDFSKIEISWSNGTGIMYLDNISVQTAPVPEPATSALLLLAPVMLAALWLRRRNNA